VILYEKNGGEGGERGKRGSKILIIAQHRHVIVLHICRRGDFSIVVRTFSDVTFAF